MKSKMWGGRFSKKTNPIVEEFTRSIQFDKKLAECDCIGSLLHIEVLKNAHILSEAEYEELKKALESILKDIRNGVFKVDDGLEDIHSVIQAAVEEKVGKLSYKLQTARSRNDQVVFDTKLYCLINSMFTAELLIGLCKALEVLSKKHKGLIMPGYTHLQHAIPIEVSQYFYAYLDMFLRDSKRFVNAANNINLTLGSGALAGTFIEASNYNLSQDILPGGKKITSSTNSIDAVSDRDFVVEMLSSFSIVGMHLSRIAEDLILWSTSEFNFIDIDEAFCTGSSLMPHKKNPDVLELIRGYAGRLYGNLLDVLVLMKGLPLSYNRDMQLDKEPLFSSFEIVQGEIKVLQELILKIKFNKDFIDKALKDECLFATDIADYLVKKGISFKEAHSLVGKLITHKITKGVNILDMKDAELKKIHPLLANKELKNIIDPKKSVASKRSVKR